MSEFPILRYGAAFPPIKRPKVTIPEGTYAYAAPMPALGWTPPTEDDFQIVALYGAPFPDWLKPEDFKPVKQVDLKARLLELIEAVLGIKLKTSETRKVQELAAQIKEEVE